MDPREPYAGWAIRGARRGFSNRLVTRVATGVDARSRVGTMIE
jgi:hypothetical protein